MEHVTRIAAQLAADGGVPDIGVERPQRKRLRITRKPAASRAAPRPTEGSNGGRRIDSKTLFADARILFIEHEGGDYQLRITNQGKLILTK